MKYPTGHLWTEVKINGMIGRFILDTGVASTAIERRRIDYFDIKVIEYTLEAIGAGGAIMPVRTTTGNNLQLGDYADGDFPLKLVRFDKVNQALRSMQEPEVDGIIGNDLLEGRCAIIDYKNLTLYLKK
jgi:predicted aspartyl protease